MAIYVRSAFNLLENKKECNLYNISPFMSVISKERKYVYLKNQVGKYNLKCGWPLASFFQYFVLSNTQSIQISFVVP